jgi:hypothetical protein
MGEATSTTGAAGAWSVRSRTGAAVERMAVSSRSGTFEGSAPHAASAAAIARGNRDAVRMGPPTDGVTDSRRTSPS